jgi:hypothetical protein
MNEVPDNRVAGMVIYPLDEILLATLIGIFCWADNWIKIELLARKYLPRLTRSLPFKCRIPRAQTFCNVVRLIKPDILEGCFASWIALLQKCATLSRLMALRRPPVGQRRPSRSSGL